MNTTYFLNCVAGNVFGSKGFDPAIPRALLCRAEHHGAFR